MPSETIDRRGLSSTSLFANSTSGDAAFRNERQIGFLKPELRQDHHAVELPSQKPLGHPLTFLMSEQKRTRSLDNLAVGAEGTANLPLIPLEGLDYNPANKSGTKRLPTYYSSEADEVNKSGLQYESSLFSSSMSELFNMKLRLSANNAIYSHSVDTVVSLMEEEEPLESIEEIEAQTIGNLLPSDEDLFTGVTDRKFHPDRSIGADDVELDLFSSVGGMELEDNGSASLDAPQFLGTSNRHPGVCNGLVNERLYGENLSRTLYVRNIDSDVEDSELKTLFEQYGDIHTLYTDCKHRGFIIVSYFDIRAARNTMQLLQDRRLRHMKLDIHYSVPKENLSNDFSKGIITIFGVDASVSNDNLRLIFGAYGDIKEMHEAPRRSNIKCIEYYDNRSAVAAFQDLNRKNIAGKQIKIEPGRPGASRRFFQKTPSELEQDEHGLHFRQNGSSNNFNTGYSVPHGQTVRRSMDNGTMMSGSHVQFPVLETTYHHGVSSSVSNGSPSLLRDSAAIPSRLSEMSIFPTMKFDLQGVADGHPHSLPEYHNGINGNTVHPRTMAGGINLRPQERIGGGQLCRVCISAGKESCSLPSQHYAWGNHVNSEHPNLLWSNSSSFGSGISLAHAKASMHVPQRAPPQRLNTVMPVTNHHVGSAPTTNPSFWDRLHSYVAESPEVSGFHPGSLGNMRMNNSLHPMEFVSKAIFPDVAGNCMDLPIGHESMSLSSYQRSSMYPTRSQLAPTNNSFDTGNERARSRKNEGCTNHGDKRHYELDVDRILRGEDNRTTIMVKNIPNKYTSKMLLAAIDERHKGTYDFIYLPIDFKNKCNVGYAFINMIVPGHIIPFYQTFNGKKWEKFNSEKVATLAYARIQGKSALIAHFQNSSLMNEDKRCRPILFSTDGPNAGDQVPFPMGPSVRGRPGKPRTASYDDNHKGTASGSANGEDFPYPDAPTGSGKESY